MAVARSGGGRPGPGGPDQRHGVRNRPSDPQGVTGTPAIDEDAGLIYHSDSLQLGDGGTFADGDQIQVHQLYALSLDDGSVKPGWPVNVGALVPGFDAACQGDDVSNCTELAEDTGAALLFQGVLYIPYAGRGGRVRSPYRGAVVGVSVSDPTRVQVWQSGVTGGSIDGPPGLSSDGISVFAAATGNTPGAAGWSGGDALLRFEPGPTFPNRSADYWAPPSCIADVVDAASWDNGATGVQLLDLPGSAPSQIAALDQQQRRTSTASIGRTWAASPRRRSPRSW